MLSGGSELKILGRHLVADFHGCSADLNDPEFVMDALERACKAAKATIVERSGHHFSPYGVTAVLIIAESHVAVHTWPEYGYAAVDIFTCGESVDTYKAFEIVKKAFKAKRVEVREVKRGLIRDEEIRDIQSAVA